MLKLLLVILTVFYPAIIYFGLAHFRPGLFGILIGLTVLLRIGAVGEGERRWLLVPVALAIGYAVAVAWWDSELLVRIYPALVNGIMLVVFGWTLVRPPSMIERIVRARNMPMSPGGETYVRRLTGIWCGFFIINAGLAIYTAAFSSLEVWALYNGLIAYIAMGVLFMGEILYRPYYQRRVAERGDPAGPS